MKRLIKRIKPIKHCCRECHFLSRKDSLHGHTNAWTKEEREKGQIKHKERFAVMCQQGIWDTGADPTLNSKLEEILNKNRKGECFFIEYTRGMLFDTAAKLHRIRYENRNLKRSLWIATVGLYISGIAALFNFFGFDNVEECIKSTADFIGGLRP